MVFFNLKLALIINSILTSYMYVLSKNNVKITKNYN